MHRALPIMGELPGGGQPEGAGLAMGYAQGQRHVIRQGVGQGGAGLRKRHTGFQGGQ